MSRFSDAVDDLAEKVHDTGSGHKTFIEGLLNEAKDAILAESTSWSFTEKTIDYSAATNTFQYTFDDLVPAGEDWEIMTIRSVLIPDETRRLRYVDIVEYDMRYPTPDDDSAIPIIWTTWENENLLVAPRTDQTYELRIRCHSNVPDFDDVNGTPPWPKQYDRTWKLYAEYLALEYDENDRAVQKYRLWEQHMNRWIGQDGSHTIPQHVYPQTGVHTKYRLPIYPDNYPPY